MRSPTQRALSDAELAAIARRVVGRELAGAVLLDGGTYSTAYRLDLADGSAPSSRSALRPMWTC